MKWQEVKATTTHAAADAVANLFYELGCQGVVVEDPLLVAEYIKHAGWDYHALPPEMLQGENVLIIGYFPVDECLEERLRTLQEATEKFPQLVEGYWFELCLNEVEEEDWAHAWKAHYKPTRVGRRLVIKPSWEEYHPQLAEVVIELDPGMAFGTGTHPTTVMCLRAIEYYLKAGDRVIDVGTGSGILAIAAAKLGASWVLAVDADPVAVSVAEENVARNGVGEIIKVQSGDLLKGITESVDVIVANIIADAIIALSESANQLLNHSGIFITSGIIIDRLEDVVTHLQAGNFTIREINQEGEWVTVVAEKE
ncbi:MAG: 50S ribosomal protein L11 methyltransferase [Firmicutes bacterium]|nr:50S ribosomal protein L11 methyltransferase [Bacillota bacterium]